MSNVKAFKDFSLKISSLTSDPLFDLNLFKVKANIFAYSIFYLFKYYIIRLKKLKCSQKGKFVIL